ncbi:hypothetical protein ACP70R_004536 [Stipagrostis hirtigluma subsp. patula]
MAAPEEEPDAKRLDAPPILGLPDDLLAKIFLRLPTLEDVGRSATVCPAFRRVIADRSFRRGLRTVHPAPFLGFVRGNFYPATAPHPSAPCARALARAADFSFKFIPSSGPSWFVRDLRDGRALVENVGDSGEFLEKSLESREFAVADPVYRRYVLLPPIPEDVGAPVLHQRSLHLEAILVPAHEEEEETSFKVICVAVCRAHLVAFVFCSAKGGWSAFPSQDWSASTVNVMANTGLFCLRWCYCAGDCFYWKVSWTDKLLVLDTRSIEFSFADLPIVQYDLLPFGIDDIGLTVNAVKCSSAIAEVGDGRTEFFTLQRDISCEFGSLYSMKRSDAGSASTWQSKKKVQVQFPLGHDFVISGAAKRYLLVKGTREWMHRYNWLPGLRALYLLLDLKTMRLEEVCRLDGNFLHLNLYTGFPPSLSLPSI